MAISPRAAGEGDAELGGSSMFARANTQISVDDLLRGLLITVRQRRRHRSRRRHRRLGERVRGAHEPGSPPAGQEPFADCQRLGVGQRGAKGDRARHGASGGLCDRHLSAILPLFRRARIHLERHPPAEPEPPSDHEFGADGLKTGHLAASGFGLVGSAVQGGRRLIAVARRANAGRQGERRAQIDRVRLQRRSVTWVGRVMGLSPLASLTRATGFGVTPTTRPFRSVARTPLD